MKTVLIVLGTWLVLLAVSAWLLARSWASRSAQEDAPRCACGKQELRNGILAISRPTGQKHVWHRHSADKCQYNEHSVHWPDEEDEEE